MASRSYLLGDQLNSTMIVGRCLSASALLMMVLAADPTLVTVSARDPVTVGLMGSSSGVVVEATNKYIITQNNQICNSFCRYSINATDML